MWSSVTLGAAFLSLPTRDLKRAGSLWFETSTASSVTTTVRSSSPSTATNALFEMTLQLCAPSNMTLPCAKLPSLSCSDNSQTARQDPTSDQSCDTGTTAVSVVRSMTA